jgi:hypothetical protein
MRDFFHQVYEQVCSAFGLAFVILTVLSKFIEDNLPSLKVSDLWNGFKRMAVKVLWPVLFGLLFIRALTTKDLKLQFQIAVLLFLMMAIPIFLKIMKQRELQEGKPTA